MSRVLNVYLCGRKVGALCEDDLSQLAFRYDDSAFGPLSVCLPLRAESYPHALAYPFFENLTPEGIAFEILTKRHEAGNKTFSILDRFGGDCAGAVAFYETGPDNAGGPLYEITDGLVAEIIDRLPTDPLLTGMKNPPRLSLAGAQSKFAVCKIDGKYYRSDDQHPTTHIIKIANARFPNLLENELFCMKLAKTLWDNTPPVELRSVNGSRYLEVERFDRRREGERVIRIHQEDFCQALGIVSDRKYQKGGGASLKSCYGVIRKFSGTPSSDTQRFIEWVIFNYLIGNTDAHAKNISLLHADGGTSLAPFYDLLSTEAYSEKLVDHETAMLINGKGRFDSMRPKDFAAMAESFGADAADALPQTREQFEHIVKTAETVREQLTDGSAESQIYDDIVTIIRRRHKAMFSPTAPRNGG